MADDVDRANDIAARALADSIRAAAAVPLDPGVAGGCRTCEHHSPRLVGGRCAPCRDGRPR